MNANDLRNIELFGEPAGTQAQKETLANTFPPPDGNKVFVECFVGTGRPTGQTHVGSVTPMGGEWREIGEVDDLTSSDEVDQLVNEFIGETEDGWLRWIG